MNQMLSTTVAYNRQETVHRLPLPKDVTDVILSFVFYDKATGEARQVHRIYMTDLVYRFANAGDSRAVGLSNGWIDPDTDEHWSISFRNFKEDPLVQLQAENCRFCGEYLTVSEFMFPIPIPCRCLRDPYEQYHQEDDDNDYYSDEDIDDEYDHLW
jgi:hypothetical protein